MNEDVFDHCCYCFRGTFQLAEDGKVYLVHKTSPFAFGLGSGSEVDDKCDVDYSKDSRHFPTSSSGRGNGRLDMTFRRRQKIAMN